MLAWRVTVVVAVILTDFVTFLPPNLNVFRIFNCNVRFCHCVCLLQYQTLFIISHVSFLSYGDYAFYDGNKFSWPEVWPYVYSRNIDSIALKLNELRDEVYFSPLSFVFRRSVSRFSFTKVFKFLIIHCRPIAKQILLDLISDLSALSSLLAAQPMICVCAMPNLSALVALLLCFCPF